MKLVWGVSLIALATCCLPALAAPRFPVTLASVAAALAAQQPELAASSLQIPDITASTPDPVLVVENVSPAGVNTARVRVSCRLAGECLPFLVTVHSAAQIDYTALKTVQPQGRTALVPPDLRSGSHTLLVIDSGQLHITLPVVALANARIGDSVRVSSLDRRLTYTARVIGPSEVKGSL